MPLKSEDRRELRQGFVVSAGWSADTIRPLAEDASTRAYYRVGFNGTGAVLMDAPPGAETVSCPPGATPVERRRLGYNATTRLAGPDSRPFAAFANALRGRGLSAPEIYAADFENGFLMIEDLGDGLFARVIENGLAPWPLYEAAVDVLLKLHESPAERALPLNDTQSLPLLSYDQTALLAETELLLEWYVPAATDRPVPDAVADAFRAAWIELLTEFPEDGDDHVLVMRDYHAENLLWLPERQGVARVGLLDFQDGLRGPAEYDLVSLLTDARRDVEPELAAAMLERYIAGAARRGGFDEAAFHRRFAILNVQRNAKILGIFARLWRRDGKPRYIRHIPRVWRYLESGLEHPALAPVKAWFDDYLPADLRGDALSE